MGQPGGVGGLDQGGEGVTGEDFDAQGGEAFTADFGSGEAGGLGEGDGEARPGKQDRGQRSAGAATDNHHLLHGCSLSHRVEKL